MKIFKNLIFGMGTLMFLAPTAYACGGCVDYGADFQMPFLVPLLRLFWIWLMLRLIFWGVGKSIKQSLPLTYSRRPWRSLLIRVVLFVGLSVLTLGSFLFPSLIVIIPSWAISVYTSQKKILAIIPKKPFHEFFLGFQWLTCLAVAVVLVYSMINTNSFSRIIKSLDSSPNFTRPRQMMLSMWEDNVANIEKYIRNFKPQGYRSAQNFRELMRMISEKKDLRFVGAIEEMFRELKYVRSSSAEDAFESSAQALTELDKNLAAKLLPIKLNEVVSQNDVAPADLRDIVRTLAECIIATGNQAAISNLVSVFIPRQVAYLDENVRRQKQDYEKTALSDLLSRLIILGIKSGDKDVLQKILSEQTVSFLFWQIRSGDILLRSNGEAVFRSLGSPEFETPELNKYEEWWQNNKKRILGN